MERQHAELFDSDHSVILGQATASATGTAGLTIKTNDGGSGGAFMKAQTWDIGPIGGNITFANADEVLTINGVGYKLIEELTGLEAISGTSSNYALAITIAGALSGLPIPSFNGVFEGLGNGVEQTAILTNRRNWSARWAARDRFGIW